MSSVVNGTKPDLFVIDELDCLKRLYTREQLLKQWEEVMPKTSDLFKNYTPYIINIGFVDGVELFQVTGDNNFFYITNRAGAEQADKLLREEAMKYGQNG